MSDNLFGNPDLNTKKSLKEQFIVPPFSVLNTSTQDWLRRRQYWLNRIGCEDKSLCTFDPVLAEVLITWFSDVKQEVFDPCFVDADINHNARGIIESVARVLKREYVGFENSKAFDLMQPNSVDVVLATPDNNLKYLYKVLKKNRFACIVCEGTNMTLEATSIMTKVGFHLHSEIIVVKPAGILRTKVGKSMNTDRRVGLVHQNVLVFYKGNMNKIKDEFSKLI